MNEQFMHCLKMQRKNEMKRGKKEQEAHGPRCSPDIIMNNVF